MKFSRVAALLVGSFVFSNAIPAQSPPAISEEEPPVLAEAQAFVPPSRLFAQQAQPEPPSGSALPQSDASDSRATEDRYRVEIKLLAQKERQFVHCKLKNGRVLTGILRDPGDQTFAIQTNALGDGTSVE